MREKEDEEKVREGGRGRGREIIKKRLQILIVSFAGAQRPGGNSAVWCQHESPFNHQIH